MPAMSSRGKALAIIGAAGFLFVLCVSRFAIDYADPDSPANAAMQYQLRMFGAAMYEYHAAPDDGRVASTTSHIHHCR
jgi:hypothetical protein